MLYLASENVVKKWTQRYRNWDQVLNQLIVPVSYTHLDVYKRQSMLFYEYLNISLLTALSFWYNADQDE